MEHPDLGEIITAIENASRASYAGDADILDICKIARRPALASVMIKERLPLEQARHRILNSMADESDASYINHHFPTK